MLSGNANAMGRSHPVPTPTPAPVPAPTDSGKGQPISGASTCVSADANHICIGVKMVSYVKNGNPVITRDQAIAVMNRISQVWSQCNIGFQLETYQAIDPTTVGLSYNVDWYNTGDVVRSDFDDHSTFLVVSTGQLSGSTTGVTEPPGVGVYGSLIEDAYAQKELTVAHELGHYQGLYHVNGSGNLMYAYAESDNHTLTQSQCKTARSTNYSYWQSMMRH
jgi:hypothetical protein